MVKYILQNQRGFRCKSYLKKPWIRVNMAMLTCLISYNQTERKDKRAVYLRRFRRDE